MLYVVIEQEYDKYLRKMKKNKKGEIIFFREIKREKKEKRKEKRIEEITSLR